MDEWMLELERGRSDAAWDTFLTRYRRLIFATIRRYAREYDDVMDVFTRVCDALRGDDLKRLRDHMAQPDHRARFSTWLVVVVRNITIDWFRMRDGRRRLSALAATLDPVRRRIFELVFLDRRTHLETYELIRARDAPELSFRRFLVELRGTYASVEGWRGGYLLRELGGIAPPESEVNVAEPADTPAAGERLAEALALLDPEDRAAVELYVIEELPAADVARIVGLPNGKAVYNRVYRALEALRERLEAAGVRRGDL